MSKAARRQTETPCSRCSGTRPARWCCAGKSAGSCCPARVAGCGSRRRCDKKTERRTSCAALTKRYSIGVHALIELAERLALDLPYALARQAQPLADLFQRLRLFVVQAEAHPQHGRLAFVHLVEQVKNVVQIVSLDHLRVRRLGV